MVTLGLNNLREATKVYLRDIGERRRYLDLVSKPFVVEYLKLISKPFVVESDEGDSQVDLAVPSPRRITHNVQEEL